MRALQVLLIDDNASYLAAAKSWLTEEPGIEVIGTATSGHAGVALTRLLSPDVVLLDLMMPEMNGFEATRLLKNLADAPSVIIVTMEDSPTLREAAFAHGANGFVSKIELVKQLRPLLTKLQH